MNEKFSTIHKLFLLCITDLISHSSAIITLLLILFIFNHHLLKPECDSLMVTCLLLKLTLPNHTEDPIKSMIGVPISRAALGCRNINLSVLAVEFWQEIPNATERFLHSAHHGLWSKSVWSSRRQSIYSTWDRSRNQTLNGDKVNTVHCSLIPAQDWTLSQSSVSTLPCLMGTTLSHATVVWKH